VIRPLPARLRFALTAGLVLLCLSPGPGKAQTLSQAFDRMADPAPPFAPEVERVLREHRIGGLSLREYLLSLDFEGCLDSVREELVAGLDGLRVHHVVALENRRPTTVWRLWDRKLDGLSPDAMLLVSTWLDSPEMARRLYLCDDGLPPSWKSLSPDAYVIEAVTWFDIEVADHEHTLNKGTRGDRELSIMELMELRDRLLDRFSTTYVSGPETDEALARLDHRLDMMWERLVEPHHFGFTPRPRTTEELASPGATGRARPGNPFGSGGVGIPDPRDVALRDRVVRSWRRQRQTIDREIDDRQARLDDAVAAIDAEPDPSKLDRLVRVASRLDAELANSVADLERLQSRTRLLQTGRPWVDGMLNNGYRRRAVRRLDRRQGQVQDQREEVVEAISLAVQRGARPPTVQEREGAGDGGSSGGGVAVGEPGPGNWLAGLPAPDGAEAAGTRAASTIPVGTGWVERVYEGPLPTPSGVWSDDLVQAIGDRHPSLDETDVRILLGLVREAYGELSGRQAVEAAVWRSLGASHGLRIRGEESTLSELWIPTAGHSDQPIITFILTLYF
jgi:hypothetical protein